VGAFTLGVSDSTRLSSTRPTWSAPPDGLPIRHQRDPIVPRRLPSDLIARLRRDVGAIFRRASIEDPIAFTAPTTPGERRAGAAKFAARAAAAASLRRRRATLNHGAFAARVRILPCGG
jgi:hypothetical protein